MKKTLIFSLLFLLTITIFTTAAKAVSGSTIVNDLYELGIKYGFTEADKLRGERYVADNPITDEQAEIMYERAKQAEKYLEQTGATDVKKLNTQLTKEQKKKYRQLCQDIADVIGLKLTYRDGMVDVYKDGKLIDTYTFTDGKLVYTGNNINFTLIGSLIVAIALISAVFVFKKKLKKE